MKYRVFGLDNRLPTYIEAPDYLRTGDTWRISKFPKLKVTDLDIEMDGKEAQIVEVNSWNFKVACVNFSKDDVFYFMYPDTMTFKQALMHQLNK